MALILSSEAEFSEEYWMNHYSRGDRSPKTSHWHQVMFEYLKKIDGGRHMVTTHFSHPHRGNQTWEENTGFDYVQSNAYSTFNYPHFGGKARVGSGLGAPHALKVYYNKYMERYSRPVIVGEYGGHWMRNSTATLQGELRTGTWATAMTPMAGNTGFWWWPFVHFGDNYGPYRAVANFMKGEDRRGTSLKDFTPALEGNSKNRVRLNAIRGRDRADIYIYHTRAPWGLDGLGKIDGLTLRINELWGDRYRVEFWECTGGTVIKARNLRAKNGSLNIELPTIDIDLAIKVRLQNRR